MDVRHQVFVSSTFRDLTEERREVMQALLELDCIPAGMELFPASSESALRLIKDVIEQSDYYIVIIGGRYGSMDSAGLSYTEMEYDFAASIGKPVLGFLHGAPESIPAGLTELDPGARERLENFRAKVEKRHCKYWSSATELGGVVSRSLVQERKRNPMPGWVRSDSLGGPETLQRLIALQEENERLTSEINGLLGGIVPGTERLEQGADPVDLSIIFRHNHSSPSETYTLTCTWDEIISLTGPLMLQESGETQICDRLALHVREAAKEDGAIRDTPYYWTQPKLTPETQSVVIVQLVALQVMEKGVRKRSPTDRGSYWKLTAYGERYLTQLRARRRSS